MSEANARTAAMSDPLRMLRSEPYPAPARANLFSETAGLQPELEHAQLPQLAGARRRAVLVRRREEPLDQARREELAVARGRRGERLAHELEVGPLEVHERGHGEVALRPVDDRVGHDAARRVLEDPLAVVGELELRRARGGELDEVVV